MHKDLKSPSSNLKKPACASKRDVLELATLWQSFSKISSSQTFADAKNVEY